MIIKKTIISVIEFVPKVTSEILKELTRVVHLAEKETMDLNLILEEAITNGIQHGNQFDTSRTVEISLELDKDDVVIIRVKDQGKGFNQKDLPDIKNSNELMNSSGRGVFLMKKLADEVSFSEEGSEICIRKKIHPGKK